MARWSFNNWPPTVFSTSLASRLALSSSRLWCLPVLLPMLFGGCKSTPQPSGLPSSVPIVAGYRSLNRSVGRVIQVHDRLRFVILDYTLSQIPPPGSRLDLYRGTNIVGSIKLSHWRNTYTAAGDFAEGSPQLGDEARPSSNQK